ncbi:hypothetical protein OH492_14570 [Vibrio chagasii]|nr:hypothetical protein [Vibrio chagasii]
MSFAKVRHNGSSSRVFLGELRAIPATTAGVGLFLGLIGLKTAGIVVENPATLVSLGDFTKPGVAWLRLNFDHCGSE